MKTKDVCFNIAWPLTFFLLNHKFEWKNDYSGNGYIVTTHFWEKKQQQQQQERDQFILTYVTTYVQWQFIDNYDIKQDETSFSVLLFFHAGKLIKSYFVIVRKSIQDR